MDALKDIPTIDSPLLTEKGAASLQKTDIFRRIMWFGYKEENTWYPLNITRVNEILALNKSGQRPATLEEDKAEVREPISVLNSDLENLDKKFKNKNKQKRRPGGQKNGKRDGRGGGGGNRNNPPNPNRNNPNNRNNPKQPRKE
jgi:hypothetical protein